MTRDLIMTTIAAILLLAWFMPNRPLLTVTVSPEIEAAAKRMIEEHVHD
jgi:hypothetical protein